MADVQPPVPPDVWAGLFAPFVSAAAGIAMRHAQRYQPGKPFDWRKIVVDAPLLIGVAFIASGLAEYLELGPKVACALAVGLGYVGTQGLDALWIKLQSKVSDKVQP